jgi:hypothetical protein
MKHVYEIRPRKDHRGVDLIPDALPFGGLWYGGAKAASNAIGERGKTLLSISSATQNFPSNVKESCRTLEEKR